MFVFLLCQLAPCSIPSSMAVLLPNSFYLLGLPAVNVTTASYIRSFNVRDSTNTFFGTLVHTTLLNDSFTLYLLLETFL